MTMIAFRGGRSKRRDDLAAPPATCNRCPHWNTIAHLYAGGPCLVTGCGCSGATVEIPVLEDRSGTPE